MRQIQGSPYCLETNTDEERKASATEILSFVLFVGKTTLLLRSEMFIMAPMLSYSSPNIDDS